MKMVSIATATPHPISFCINDILKAIKILKYQGQESLPLLVRIIGMTHFID